MHFASRPRAVRQPTFVLAAITAAMLAACGGGGDDAPAAGGGSNNGGGTNNGGGQSAALSVAGVAAKGAALAGATVNATCATGTGTATTGVDGSYTITITDGALPCVLEATDGTTTLHSVATGSGASATANITPITELVVAQITGQDPAAFFAAAAGSITTLTGTVTTDAVTSAATAVVQTLTAAGVDASTIGNPVTGAITAGSGTGYDGVLDTIGATLQATGTTLVDLAAAVATTSPAAIASAPTTTSGSEAATNSLLPAPLLLKAKASSCDALRATDYQLLVVKPSAATGATSPLTVTGAATVDLTDPAAPKLAYDDGSSEALVPVAGERCHFTLAGNDGGTADVMVAPSGVVMARSSATWTSGETVRDPNFRLVIGLPKQTLAVADLAGQWNAIGWQSNGAGAFEVDSVIVNTAADGKVSFNCTDGSPTTAESACAPEGPYTGFSANADGGFDFTMNAADGTTTARAWAFRAGNGQTLVALLHADGSLHLLTPYRTLTQPAVGDAHKAWNIQLNAQMVSADALAYNSFAITGVDTAAGTFTRTAAPVATGVTTPQTLKLNTARNGWVYRAGGSATASDGSTTTIREMYSLKLGVGISAYWLPASNQAGTNARFGLSVAQP